MIPAHGRLARRPPRREKPAGPGISFKDRPWKFVPSAAAYRERRRQANLALRRQGKVASAMVRKIGMKLTPIAIAAVALAGCAGPLQPCAPGLMRLVQTQLVFG